MRGEEMEEFGVGFCFVLFCSGFLFLPKRPGDGRTLHSLGSLSFHRFLSLISAVPANAPSLTTDPAPPHPAASAAPPPGTAAAAAAPPAAATPEAGVPAGAGAAAGARPGAGRGPAAALAPAVSASAPGAAVGVGA